MVYFCLRQTLPTYATPRPRPGRWRGRPPGARLRVVAGLSRDPARPPRYWAPEAHRLRCAVWDAYTRLPYSTADARLLDGFEKWLGWTGKGQPVPGPWWTLACGLARGVYPALADATAARLVAPWGKDGGTGVPAGDPGGFRPLGG